MEIEGSSHREIHEPRLIAGYMRDALLSESNFVVEWSNTICLARILSMTEPSSRDKSSNRTIRLRLLGLANPSFEQTPELELGTEISLRVANERILIKFQSKVILLESSEFIINLPTVIVAVLQRESVRFKVENLTQKSSVVRLSNSNTVHLAVFEITDISSTGMGGIVSNLPEGDVNIEGYIPQSTGAIHISGFVSWRIPVPERGATYFRIGVIDHNESDFEIPRIENAERRKHARTKVHFPIEIFSPLSPDNACILQLEDISMRGLRAKPTNKADFALIRPGLELTLGSPRLRLQVISTTKDEITFKIVDASIEEGIRLFNLVCSFTQKDVVTDTPITKDFLQLFAIS
ncbi:MAG: hypothetical protein AABZ55_08240, partial [Bdellovibrionota bacterium]